MKTTVTKEEGQNYPCLMIDVEDNVILLLGKGIGTVVAVGNNPNYEIGHTSTKRTMDKFTLFAGVLELEND